MTKLAQFYLLKSTEKQGELNPEEALACDLAAQAWRIGKKILIACETEQQALNIDEALWARDADSFVPHNLSGESTHFSTPIEISWIGKRNSQRRDLLINLQNLMPDFANSFNQVIDFVPAREEQKIAARERYKQYRNQGFQLETQNS